LDKASVLQFNLQAEASYTVTVLHKIACERDEVRQAEFLHLLHHGFSGSGNEFVVVNEPSKNECSLFHHYGHAPVGQVAEMSAPFVRGQQYSLCMAMTTEGYLARVFRFHC